MKARKQNEVQMSENVNTALPNEKEDILQSFIQYKVAAVYVRVSTDDQLELSPDSQIKEVREYAKRNGYIVDDKHIYIDEGISGRSVKKRDAFNAVIAAAKSKPRPFDAILVWKFSRFARNQEESIVYKSLLKKQGVDVISISEPLPEGPFGGLVERIIEWMDEYYSIRLSGEVKRGMKEKILRGGIVTGPAFGYDIVDGVYVPNKDADIVRMIFNDYIRGIGIITIARNLISMGVRTKRGNLPDNRFVRYILSNPVYIGKLRWSLDGRKSDKRVWGDDCILVEGKHEPIITESVWNAVQEKLKAVALSRQKYQRSEPQNVRFMLKGLVRCSACNSTLVCASQKSMSVQCHSYNRGQCQESHSVVITKLNAALITELRRILEDQQYVLSPKMVETPKINYDDLLKYEYTRLEKIKNAYYNGIDTVEEYAENKKLVLKAIEDIEQKRKEAPSVPTADMKHFKKKLLSVIETITDENISEEVKNEVLRSIIEKIIYNKKEDSIEVYLYTTE